MAEQTIEGDFSGLIDPREEHPDEELWCERDPVKGWYLFWRKKPEPSE